MTDILANEISFAFIVKRELRNGIKNDIPASETVSNLLYSSIYDEFINDIGRTKAMEMIAEGIKH